MAIKIENYAKKGLRSSYASTIIGISLVLFMIGLVLGGVLGLRSIEKQAKESLQGDIFFKSALNDADIKQIEQQLKSWKEFSEVYFSNRREAIKFRNLLVGLFEGDIDYIQPNGKDFKEDIIETWCDHEERPVELSELEDFIDKLRMTSLNKLYRD